MMRKGKTRPFRGPDGRIPPDSIAEAKFVRLGGIDQWVMIRGENTANPPLILLYGGPGFAESAFFRYFNAPLEKDFTVVYWDQRGSGRSYSRKVPKSSLTLEQFMTDLGELVDYVCRRLGQSKVVLYGHSWGSILGVLYAARHPEKVAAYVGSGQIGSWNAGESASYNYALSEARRRNNHKALKQLRAIGPPPYDAKSLWTERLWVNRFDGRMSLRSMWEVWRIFSRRPESSFFDFPRIMRRMRATIGIMWPEVSQIDLPKMVNKLKVPVFFFLGRQDHWVPPQVSIEYFNTLSAPSKTLRIFDKSGHEPFADEPAAFNAAMTELVRPAVQA